MLKRVIETEMGEQGIDRAVLLDGICTEEDFCIWMEEDEPVVWLMQVHAMVQRLGRSVDKYDVMLTEEEYALVLGRSEIWRLIRRGELERAEAAIAEYGESFKKSSLDMVKIPEGERALQQQFLALSQAEIARRRAAPYSEQLEIILGGLRQTIPDAAWEKRQGELWPDRTWFKTRRLHLLELFLLARFARVWECMGQEEGNKCALYERGADGALVSDEVFSWYRELAAYISGKARDRADVGKLYPLMCYRMAENRLRRIFGGNAWWGGDVEVGLLPEEVAITFMAEGEDEQEEFRDAQECMRILESLTDALHCLALAQKQYPLFRKMENMRLALLRRIPLFGEHTVEENTWRVLGRAWEGMCRAVRRRNAGNAKIIGVRGALSEEGMCDFDSLDTDYMERSMHNFRELLSGRMELHGWDIYGLGDGIYADPKKSLRPILSGKANPKPKKLRALQDRLGMSWKKFDPGFLTEDDAEYKKYARMMRAYYSGEIEEGRKLLEELEEKIDWEYMTNEQFAAYWDALFDWKCGKITEKGKNKEMWKLLEHSGVKREKFAEVGCSLTRMEWRALTEITWNPEGEDLAFLLKVLEKQKEYLEKTGKAGFFREYYIKIFYCLCYIEREMGNLDEAEQYTEEGLGLMYEMNLYTQWGAFLFEKFRIIEDRKQGEMEDGDFEYIRQAYAVEKMFLESKMGCIAFEKYLNEHYEQNVLADMKGEC